MQQIQFCTDDEHVNAKMYKLLLKLETEEEQLKECVIR